MSWDGQDRRLTPQQMTKEDLKNVMDSAMERHIHSDAHTFVEVLMEKEKRKQELWEAIKKHVYGWTAVAVVGFVAASVWHEVMDSLTKFFYTGISK